MPTPVATAKLCLTEEAARVLDDAVSVARRRCHAQTTSLHAVSALLSLPSSFLRDACSRVRSPMYSSRFQFRALDLCVGVSLDRLQSSKSSAGGGSFADDDPPPVSNSLMAAIKRSQANQRRMPEMYQITQHAASSMYSISTIKVELKNFVISILDDPIVSRVLGDAGFRSTDIKLAILHPPAPNPPSRYFRGAGERCPPLFLCNLTDSLPSLPGNIPFHFPRGGGGDCDGDENCRRIGEVLAKISGRNPLLVGVCARDALVSFKKRMENGKGEGVLPGQIAGLNLICLEKEITEFISNVGSKEGFDSKAEELNSALERHSGPGVVVNFGELKLLVEAEGVSEDHVKCLVAKLSSLIKVHREKMWLIGAAADYETYRKFLNRFPSLEVDWDLHPLPITSSRSSATELYSKSSLMGSFVPFGGFFSTPSDFRSPLGITNKPFTRCSMCNEKYERELSAITSSRGSSVSVADQRSSSLPSWLQMANSDARKAQNVATEIIDEKAESSANVLGLQTKWDDICQRLHQGPAIPRPAPSISNPAVPCAMGLHYIAEQRSRSGSLHSNDGLKSNLDSSVSATVQKTFAQEHNIKAPGGSFCDNFCSQTKSDSTYSKNFPPKVDGAFPAQSSCSLNLAPDHVSSSSLSCVTTGLGLGTSASMVQELKKPNSHLNRGQLQYLSSSSTERPVTEKATNRVFPYSHPAAPELRCQLRDSFDGGGDYKLIVQKLTEKVAWQMEACLDVGQIISRRRAGNSEHCASNGRHDTWIGFIGPDKVGKKKMAEALAELMFGSKENLIAVDLSVQERLIESHPVFDIIRLPDDIGMKTGRKTVVDYIAGELSKKPRSVVFLDNVDETDDPLAQRSLLHAIRTGKLPDSHAREISIANAVFLIALKSTEEDQVHSSLNTREKFTEQRILNALSWQMKIVIEHVEGKATSKFSNTSTVTLANEKSASHTVSANKKRQNDTDEPFGNKKLKGFLDLNVPLEEDAEDMSEMEINADTNTISDSSRVWLHDFLEQVHRKVAFKPFNFDAFANKLLNKMNLSLQRSLGPGFRLEVDQEVMSQILAAALCSNGDGLVDDWIKQVLGGACAEAQRRYHLRERTGLKLISCTGMPVDKQAPGIRLPRVINLS